MKSFSIAAPVMAAIALFVATTASATITVEANRDARMRVSVPHNNYGDFYSLDLTPTGSNTTTGLVGFDNLPALTGAEVVSATLELHSWLGTGHTIEARAVGSLGGNDWVEGSGPPGGAGATWKKYDGVNDWPSGVGGGLGDVGALLDSEVVAATNTILTLTVTDAVKAWLDGTANNGFLLNAVTFTGNTGNDNRMATREAAAASALDPTIFGDYVPYGLLQPPRLVIEENLLPTATVFTWEADDDGNWANSASWSFSGPASQGVANDPSHTAIFDDEISTDTTVVTNVDVTVNRIEFANTSNTYNIAGVGSVNLAAATSPQNPTIDVLGTHQFQARVNLQDSTSVTVASGSTLEFNNRLFLNGQTLTKTGDGTLAINNDLISGGGTINVVQGTVSGSGTVGGGVNNDSGTISPGNILVDSSIAVVPEPTACGLLLIGIVAAYGICRRRRDGIRPLF